MTVQVKSASEMPPRQLSCGLDFCSVPDIRSSLTVASEAGYNFVCFPIVHPRFKREFIGGKCKGRDGPFTRSDLILPGSDWNTLIVGKISSYIDVDCLVPAQRKQYEAAFIQELQYASHLCLPAVMVSLHGLNITNLARLLNNKIQSNCSYQIWVHVPMECPSVGSKNYYLNEKDDSEKEDVLKPCTWNCYLQCMCMRISIVILSESEVFQDCQDISRNPLKLPNVNIINRTGVIPSLITFENTSVTNIMQIVHNSSRNCLLLLFKS